MGGRAVGKRIPRSKQFRLLALSNTIYVYKGLMYSLVFAWAIFGMVTSYHRQAWDYNHIGRIAYFLLHFSLLASPTVSFIAWKTKHQIVSLYLSFAADSSMAFAIFGYSMIIMDEFGVVADCPMMWGMSVGLLGYAIGDLALIRLINSQPDLASEDHLATVRAEIDRARLKEYVGLHKWQGLAEAAGGAEILENIIKQKNNR